MALFRLLSIWVDSCQSAARSLLKSTDNLFVVELIANSPLGASVGIATISLHVRALAALLVGLCLEHWGDSVDEQSGWGREHILSLIDNRVGLSTFMGAMASLDHRIFTPG